MYKPAGLMVLPGRFDVSGVHTAASAWLFEPLLYLESEQKAEPWVLFLFFTFALQDVTAQRFRPLW